MYGIRRSGRPRKEPERLNAAESDSSERGKRKVVPKKSSKRQVMLVKQNYIKASTVNVTE